MKLHNYILSTLILILGIACSGGDEPTDNTTPETSTLEVDKTTLSFEAAGGTEQVSISSNTSWRVSSSDRNVATSSISVGKDDATITITASENTSTEGRTAVITVSSVDGSASELQITITQDAAEEGNEVELPDNIDADNTDMSSLSSV
ncbi:MAG: BACON domain-containing protein, partial [Mangrovibacterium sp.]